VSYGKLGRLSVEERRQWLRFVPEFVVEVISPSDRYPDLKSKMAAWINNGVELGWLVHPDNCEVLIYPQSCALPEFYAGTHLTEERLL
jgi:Uma2 family endonuclease